MKILTLITTFLLAIPFFANTVLADDLSIKKALRDEVWNSTFFCGEAGEEASGYAHRLAYENLVFKENVTMTIKDSSERPVVKINRIFTFSLNEVKYVDVTYYLSNDFKKLIKVDVSNKIITTSTANVGTLLKPVYSQVKRVDQRLNVKCDLKNNWD